ncbi:thioredoxin family protein [Emticicia sp.]|uniref:thioredoxin family protein n=1 Tax=Emticicia sp. TaxID=1930953 RepID=UPI00375083B7
MKKIVLVSILLCIINIAFSQGIAFEPTIEAAFKKAKASGKPVFVECYSPHCPICMSLEPTLKNAEVGKYYNQNFVSYKLNVEDAKQVAFLTKKKIYLPGFPLFFYFDNNQNLLHLTDPINTPKDLIQHAKTAIDPNLQTGGFWKKYQAGNRDISTMTGLAYLLRVTQDTARNIQVANELYKAYPKNQLNDKASWAIVKKCIMDIENGFAEYWLNNIEIAKKHAIEEGHPGTEMNSLGMLVQMAIYDPKASKFSLAKVNKLKNYMGVVGAGQYVTGATWQIECPAILREQGQDKAFAFLQNLINAQTQPQLLVYYTTFYNTNFTDGKFANNARQWLTKARPQLKTEQEIANLNYESARLYQKTGDLANAKKEISAAKASIATAKTKITDPNLKKVVASVEKNINKLAGELK